MQFPWKAHLAIFSANFIYGANYSIAKEVMPAFFKPFGLILLRVVGAVLLFFLLFLNRKERVERSDMLRLVFCGLTGVAINQLCFFKGLSLTSPIEASIILTANPLLVLLAAAVIARERITSLKLLGIGLGMTGALILILQRPSSSDEMNHFWGNLFILINAASYGIYLVLVRPLMNKYRVSTVMTWVFGIGLLFVFPVGMKEASEINWATIPNWAFASLGFIILGTTFLAYLFNAYGLRHVSASVVSSYIYLQPFLAALIAIAWGKDYLSVDKLISAAFIFTGVYLISKPAKTREEIN